MGLSEGQNPRRDEKPLGFPGHGVRASLENFGQMDRLEIYPIYGIGHVLT